MKVGKDILRGKIYMHVALNWPLFKIGPAVEVVQGLLCTLREWIIGWGCKHGYITQLCSQARHMLLYYNTASLHKEASCWIGQIDLPEKPDKKLGCWSAVTIIVAWVQGHTLLESTTNTRYNTVSRWGNPVFTNFNTSPRSSINKQTPLFLQFIWLPDVV